MKEDTLNISELVGDDQNFNKGTKEGANLMDHSLSQFGVGRSILIDKHNRIIAGNKTVEAAIRKGLQKVIVVETVGDELVAVKRTDIDLSSKKGREFALADNMTGNINFDIDYAKVNEVMKDVERNPELWGVRIGEYPHTLGGVGKDPSTESVQYGTYTILITEEELTALQKSASEYVRMNGDTKGFVKYIIDRYDERHNM